MTKLEFLSALGKGLSGLPQDEVEERLNFYSEMIDDRMEEGLPEEEAVAQIGAVDEIVDEPAGGAQKNRKAACAAVRKSVLKALRGLVKIPVDELVAMRYKKLRAYGNFYK